MIVYNIADVFNPEFFEVFPMFVLNIASPILSIAFFEDEQKLIVLSYKGVHTFLSCCPPNEMLFPISTPGSPAQTPPICQSLSSNLTQPAKKTLNPLLITKSPLVSPTISNTSQTAWQLPVSPTATMALNSCSPQNLNVQSHSLPQTKSSPQQSKVKQNSGTSFLQIPKQQQKSPNLQLSIENKEIEKKKLIKTKNIL